MTTRWSSAQETTDGLQMGSSSHYKELYERAREATQEAQREGDFRLKAAMAAATAARYDPIRLSLFSLKFNNSILETAYCRKSSTNSNIKDIMPFSLQLVACIAFIFILVQAHREDNIVSMKGKEIGCFHEPIFLTQVLLHSFVAAISAGVLFIQRGFSCWYRSNRGTILLCSMYLLWIEEGIKLLIPCLDSSCGLIFTSFQCILMSILDRVPFWLHVKTRALGFGLQTIAILARARFNEAALLFSCICLCHCIGVGLAYALDQQSRLKFLQSLPKWILDEMSGDGSGQQFLPYRVSFSRQMLHIFYPELFEKPKVGSNNFSTNANQNIHQQTPHRALGGFAGGFGGVSSLKGNYATSFSSVSSLGNGFWRVDQISEYSDHFYSGDNKKYESPSLCQHSPGQPLSGKNQGQPRNSYHSTTVSELRMYRRHQAITGHMEK